MVNIGKIGEDAASKYLKRHFYKILARNYRVRWGEIDIVAYKGGTLAFVEVKTRTSDIYGSPKDAVDEAKIQRFSRARRDLTDHYLRDGRIPVSYGPFTVNKKVFTLRNDIMEVYAKRSGEIISINHIKDAFE